MFRPTPDTFFGSTCHEGLQGDGLAEALVPCFGALAILGALAVWIGAYIHDGRADPFEVLKVSCYVLLALSLSGAWLSRRVALEPQRLTTRLYMMLVDRLAPSGPLAVPHVGEHGIGSLASLIGQLVRRARRLDRTGQAANTMRQAIYSSQAKAARLTIDLRYEAAELAQAATQVDATGACIGREMSASAGSLALGDLALGRAVDSVDRMTDGIGVTTSCVERMTLTAVQLSNIAHAAHATVAEQDGRSANLVMALDQIGDAVQSAMRTFSEAVQPQTQNAVGDDTAARPACEAQLAIERCRPALAAAHAVLRDIVSETVAVNRRIIEISEIIGKQHELGVAVGHAVQQQAADISAILNDLYEARSGFAVLRASVDAVMRAGTLGTDVAATMRETAQRLPSQADRIAEILRGIPDFGPSDEA